METFGWKLDAVILGFLLEEIVLLFTSFGTEYHV